MPREKRPIEDEEELSSLKGHSEANGAKIQNEKLDFPFEEDIVYSGHHEKIHNSSAGVPEIVQTLLNTLLGPYRLILERILPVKSFPFISMLLVTGLTVAKVSYMLFVVLRVSEQWQISHMLVGGSLVAWCTNARDVVLLLKAASQGVIERKTGVLFSITVSNMLLQVSVPWILSMIITQHWKVHVGDGERSA